MESGINVRLYIVERDGGRKGSSLGCYSIKKRILGFKIWGASGECEIGGGSHTNCGFWKAAGPENSIRIVD